MAVTNNHITVLGKVKIVVKSIVRAVLIFINNLYCIPAHLILLAFLQPLLLKKKPKIYWAIEGMMFRWMLALVSFWGWSSGYTIAEVGDDVSDAIHDECVVIVNHQSTGDVPMLMHAMQNKGHLTESVLWIQEIIFKYSNFGWVSIFHKDFFIKQGRETRHLQGKLLKEHLLKWFDPLNRKWIYLFPEGGFLCKRKKTSQEYAKKNGYPVLEHVTLPRIGAMQAILETLSPKGIKLYGDQMPKELKPKRPLKWMIDITIGYPDGQAMDLMTIICGWRPPCETTMHYRKYPIDQLPLDSEELTAWLYDRFIEKEALLEEYHKTGKFPSRPSTCNHVDQVVNKNGPLRIHLDNSYIALLHLFFMTLSWVEYKIITQVVELLWELLLYLF